MNKAYDKVESPKTFSYVDFFFFLSLFIWFGIRNSHVFEGLKWEVGHGFSAAITTGPFSSTAR